MNLKEISHGMIVMGKKRLEGLLLGCAVGDALGLPREGLSSRRARRIFGEKLRHNLFMGLGACSDDTDHCRIVSQCLLQTSSSSEFERCLAWKLRGWFLTLPPGLGMATAKSCLKLLVGFPARCSGVVSAGNGPAMRSAIIGAFFADDFQKIKVYNRISSRITHTDPSAEEGAWVIAVAAAYAMQGENGETTAMLFFRHIFPVLKGAELIDLLARVKAGLEIKLTLADMARQMGMEQGISGYINQTVPMVIFAWLRYFGHYEATITELIRQGGDTDTTAAIAGSLAGITCRREGIPASWQKGIFQYPSIHWLSNLAVLLEQKKEIQHNKKRVFLLWPLLLIQNLLLLCIVLLHGVRRLLPPY